LIAWRRFVVETMLIAVLFPVVVIIGFNVSITASHGILAGATIGALVAAVRQLIAL